MLNNEEKSDTNGTQKKSITEESENKGTFIITEKQLNELKELMKGFPSSTYVDPLLPSSNYFCKEIKEREVFIPKLKNENSFERSENPFKKFEKMITDEDYFKLNTKLNKNK